jgi:hypothetical protein
MIYKLQKTNLGEVCSITIVSQLISIPFDPANTDYANFRKEILADEAQLQDADGNTMTAEQAKTYVATLP